MSSASCYDDRNRNFSCQTPAHSNKCLQVLFTEGLWVPLVVLEGVHILPGIPRLFKQMIESNLSSLPTGPAYVREELGTQLGEGDLSSILSNIADAWPQVRSSSR